MEQVKKKLHADRKQIIRLSHFHYTVEVIYTEDIMEYARSHGWTKILDDFGGKHVIAYHAYNAQDCKSWLMFHHDPSIRTIAHEVFHCVWQIMKHIGAEHENEVMAYHTGHLVGLITDNLYKHDAAYAEVRELNKKPKKTLTKIRAKRKV